MKIFKEFAAKIAGQNYNDQAPKTFFEVIQDFDAIVKVLDKKFIWNKVSQKTEDNFIPESTALVYGECGQGKSTVLNTIVDLVIRNEECSRMI